MTRRTRSTDAAASILMCLFLTAHAAPGCTKEPREGRGLAGRALEQGDPSKVVLRRGEEPAAKPTPQADPQPAPSGTAKNQESPRRLATPVPTPPDALKLEEGAPLAPDSTAARAIPEGTSSLPAPWWTGSGPVRASGAEGGRVIIAPVDLQGAAPQSSLLEVSEAGTRPLVENLARVDGVSVSSTHTCFIEFPNGAPGGDKSGTTSGITVKRRAADGAVSTLMDRFDGGHRIVGCDGPIFWIAPVREQGRLGGLGRFDVETGARTEHLAELGPAFSLQASGSRIYFMAHRRGGQDVIYSINPSAADLRAHVKMPRGLLSMAIDASDIYWSRLGADGRSTEFGAVALDGKSPPRSLGRIEGVVLDGVALGDGGLLASTSPAQQPGLVVRLALDSQDVFAYAQVPRVWQLLSDDKGAYLHHEVVAKGGNGRAITRVGRR